MFVSVQDRQQQKYYLKMLGVIGSLSRLFSSAKEPYLDYRIAENLFCKSFGAENLSRADVSADAKKGLDGIAIKTFLDRAGNSFEKIAEFNRENAIYRDAPAREKIQIISGLRNKRLESTCEWHELERIVYHCITRGGNDIFVYECHSDPVDVPSIRMGAVSESSIAFSDRLNDYRFSNSKSTLYRRFKRKATLLQTKVSILEDPFVLLEKLLDKELKGFSAKDRDFAKDLLTERTLPLMHPTITLPLYAERASGKYIPARSGLNQWNADGRLRNSNEVYIPVPAWIHKAFAGFFPPQNVSFQLRLPNGVRISAKICQQGGKALMSNPNKALGRWLLRGIMNLNEDKLVEYRMLEEVGVDSVIVQKVGPLEFEIDVARTGTFDEFKAKYKP